MHFALGKTWKKLARAKNLRLETSTVQPTDRPGAELLAKLTFVLELDYKGAKPEYLELYLTKKDLDEMEEELHALREEIAVSHVEGSDGS